MNFLSLLPQLTGFFGTKFVMGILVTIFIGMSGTIYYQQDQKDELRQEIINISKNIVSEKATYELCLQQIDILNNEHNNQLLAMVEKAKLENVEQKLKIAEAKINSMSESKEKLENAAKIIKKQDWSSEKLNDELKAVLNEKN